MTRMLRSGSESLQQFRCFLLTNQKLKTSLGWYLSQWIYYIIKYKSQWFCRMEMVMQHQNLYL